MNVPGTSTSSLSSAATAAVSSHGCTASGYFQQQFIANCMLTVALARASSAFQARYSPGSLRLRGSGSGSGHRATAAAQCSEELWSRHGPDSASH
eukprot:1940039-Rhodomonas_salina.1